MFKILQNSFTSIFMIIFENMPKDNIENMIIYIMFVSLALELCIFLFKSAMKKII